MKKAMVNFGPISVGAGRVFCGAAVLCPIWLFQKRSWPFQKKHILTLIFIVLAGYVLPYTMQPYLVNKCNSGFIGMMVSFVPLMTLLVSMPILKVYPSRRQTIGVLGGLGCMGLILKDGTQKDFHYIFILLALMVPLSYALTNTFIKNSFKGISALDISFCGLCLSSLVLVPLAIALPSEQITYGEGFTTAVISIVALGALGTGIAMLMFYKLIQDHGPLFAGMVTYLVPIGAIMFGWLDKEKVSGLQIAALVGILLMVGLVQYGATKAEPKKPIK